MIDALIGLSLLVITFSGIEIGPVTAPDLFLIPAAIMLGLRCTLSGAESVPPWLIASAGVILGAGFLSHAIFGLEGRGIIILLQFSVSLVYVPLILSLGVRSPKRLRQFCALYVTSVGISALFAVLEFLGVTDIASRITGSKGFNNTGRPAGFSAHPNQLGLMCVLALPIAMHLYRRNRLWSLSILLSYFGAMASGSRTALIGALLAPVVMWWVEGRISTSRLVKGALILGLVGVITSVLGVDLALKRTIVPDSSVAVATEARNETLKTAFDDIRAYPLTGVRFGKGAHSLYLEIPQGAGILALAGFLFFAARTVRTAQGLQHDPLAVAARASMICWLITGLIHPGLYDRYLYVPAGIILAAHALDKRRRRTVAGGRHLGTSLLSTAPVRTGEATGRIPEEIGPPRLAE